MSLTALLCSLSLPHEHQISSYFPFSFLQLRKVKSGCGRFRSERLFALLENGIYKYIASNRNVSLNLEPASVHNVTIRVRNFQNMTSEKTIRIVTDEAGKPTLNTALWAVILQ